MDCDEGGRRSPRWTGAADTYGTVPAPFWAAPAAVSPVAVVETRSRRSHRCETSRLRGVPRETDGDVSVLANIKDGGRAGYLHAWNRE